MYNYQVRSRQMLNVEKLTSDERTILSAVMYNLIFMNDLTMSAMFDALEKIHDSRYYRHQIKRGVNLIRKDMREYNAKLNKKTGGRIEFIADLNDTYAEQLNVDLLKLNETTKNELNRTHTQDAELIASIYIATTLILGSCYNNDHAFDSFPELRMWSPRFRWLKLTHICNAFLNLVKSLKRETGCNDYEERLDECVNIQNGFKILANKLQDTDNIIATCNRHADTWDAENRKDVRNEEMY